MDRGLAGTVAVALLGCAVILAIAFQISEGLAMKAERHGGGAGVEIEVDGASTDGTLGSRRAFSVDSKPANAVLGGVGEADGPKHDSNETRPNAISGIDQAEELTSDAPKPGNMTDGPQGTPTPAKEINPAEGHTVSRQAADEFEERARKLPLREQDQSRIPNMPSNDLTSPGRPDLTAPDGSPGAEAAPAIEMIRGIRRSTEPVAASENQD